MICKICKRDIYKEDPRAKRKSEKKHDRLETVHLDCFLRDILFPLHVPHRFSPTDGLTIDPQGLCHWCRGIKPTIKMSRTGQEVCLPCLHALVSSLSSFYAENLDRIPWVTGYHPEKT